MFLRKPQKISKGQKCQIPDPKKRGATATFHSSFRIFSILDIFTKSDENTKNVVMVEYPRKGSWAVGFATKENKGEISNKLKQNLVNVFVPTTPNPTSGFLIMFPKEEVIYLDMSFEEASRFIVSAGSSEPK